MSQSTYLIICGLIPLALIPFARQMMELRIKILRWLHLNRLADWHERHNDGIVIAVRIILVVMACLLLYLGLWDA